MENLIEQMSLIGNFKRFLIAESKYRQMQYIVIHHSLTKDRQVVDWDAIKNYHTSCVIDGHIVSEKEFNLIRQTEPTQHWFKKPWRDIGYHYGIELVQDQYIIQSGRSLTDSGAHAGIYGRSNMFNEIGIGICVIGNYDNIQLPDGALYKLIYLVKMLKEVFQIPKLNIIGHRDIYKYFGMPKQKSCPGKLFNIDKLKEQI